MSCNGSQQFGGVTFHPWIGRRYGHPSNQFDSRVLILGHSFYGDTALETRPAHTREEVRKHGQIAPSRFFAMVVKFMLGTRSPASRETHAQVWEQLAFYNFVQFALKGPKHPPSFRQWVESQDPYRTVLKVLSPDAVLMLGCTVAHHVLDWPDGIEYEVVPHPASFGPKFDVAIPKVRVLLERAEQAARRQRRSRRAQEGSV